MSGEVNPQEQHPREPRRNDRPDGGRESSDSHQQRNRNRRSGGGGGRKGAYRFEDGLEHDICQLVTHRAPAGFPVIGRQELATMPPAEVARSETRVLLCDGRHDGPHLWPNGDETF